MFQPVLSRFRSLSGQAKDHVIDLHERLLSEPGKGLWELMKDRGLMEPWTADLWKIVSHYHVDVWLHLPPLWVFMREAWTVYMYEVLEKDEPYSRRLMLVLLGTGIILSLSLMLTSVAFAYLRGHTSLIQEIKQRTSEEEKKEYGTKLTYKAFTDKQRMGFLCVGIVLGMGAMYLLLGAGQKPKFKFLWVIFLGPVAYNLSYSITSAFAEILEACSTYRVERIIASLEKLTPENPPQDDDFFFHRSQDYAACRVDIDKLWVEAVLPVATELAGFVLTLFFISAAIFKQYTSGQWASLLGFVPLEAIIMFGFFYRLKKIAAISSMSDCSTPGFRSIHNALLSLLEKKVPMTPEQRRGHRDMLTLVNSSPCGARVLLKIDANLIIKLAASSITLVTALFSYALSIVGAGDYK